MTMQQTPAVKPNYGYYRQPDGRVTLSPANDLDELKYSRMGWTALRQYGKFEATSPYVANHPLEGLFLAGGAKELSLEQITVQGFHVDPPTVPGCGRTLNQFHPHHAPACFEQVQVVYFPQLEGVDLAVFPCSFGCGRTLPTEPALQQHERVAHAPEKSDERTGESLAAALAKALISGFGGKVPAANPAEEAPALDVPAQIAEVIMVQQQAIEALRAELEAVKTRQASVPKQRRARRAKVAA